jgi:hypothetical protein
MGGLPFLKDFGLGMMRLAIAIGALILLCGCGILPHTVQQPTIHNPFPQLNKVAVAPFFNLSSEPTVDGRQFAEDYFGALQSIPGFEVVPVGVTEQAMRAHNLQLNSPEQARQLAQILSVDAIVIGAITDFSAYYPPRCGLQVEWYAANPGFHPVPPGYGLPWGTTEEEFIPPSLKLEAEFALARAQLTTQSPQPDDPNVRPASAQKLKSRDALILPAVAAAPAAALMAPMKVRDPTTGRIIEVPNSVAPQLAAANTAIGTNGTAPADASIAPLAAGAALSAGAVDGLGESGFPPDWPDPRGFIPPPPQPVRPPYIPSNEPVMRHARVYVGNDADFTTALENYSYSRDDARKDGWQGTLQRSDEFIRFCCYKHIAEMLTARGGAGESKVLYRWEESR